MRDINVRDKWIAAGGGFHGPNVEHGYMEEAKLIPYLRDLYEHIAALEFALSPFAFYYRVNDCQPNDRREAIEVPIDDLRLAQDLLSTRKPKSA